ncbi:MAG: hypothetical protein OEW35_14015 [Gammaproteobacteria bacterium]|nr:hypothetical protein [Gammaproteobacteria bacterium]
MPLSCRSLWVSYLHLGTGAAKAAELLDFLAAVRPDRICLVGDIVDLDASINAVGRLLGLGHVPVSTWIKQRLAAAHDYMQRFERTDVEYASERRFDGIVCGHIHRPTLARVAGCLYANDGDWVEHGTALAELPDGRLQLLQWQSRVVSIDCLPFTRALAA